VSVFATAICTSIARSLLSSPLRSSNPPCQLALDEDTFEHTHRGPLAAARRTAGLGGAVAGGPGGGGGVAELAVLFAALVPAALAPHLAPSAAPTAASAPAGRAALGELKAWVRLGSALLPRVDSQVDRAARALDGFAAPPRCGSRDAGLATRARKPLPIRVGGMARRGSRRAWTDILTSKISISN
jgi:hypothetical protein